MNQKSLPLTDKAQQLLLAETNNECANPDCQSTLFPSNTEFVVVFDPAVKHVDNYLALCTECSASHKNGNINQAAIQAWKVLSLALSGSMQNRPVEMKLGALHNYPGLRPFFPDKYLAYPFSGGQLYLNIKESQMMLARALDIYEPDKTQAIRDLLKSGQTFIDVGGNKGDFSLLAANIVGPDGRVLTFEPEPDNCHWIKNSTQLNQYNNIQLFDIALSDNNEVAQLFIGEKSGWHSLISSQGNTDNRTIEVETHRLDSVLERIDIQHVDMIKIDVEGAEMAVLNGAEELLDNNPELILLLDLHPHMGVDPDVICKLLTRKGFRIHSIKHPHEELTLINNTTTEILAKR